MKQSDLKYWKWTGSEWRTGTGVHSKIGESGTRRLAIYYARNVSCIELRELALIAEHMEQTGKLGPEPEEITAEEVASYLDGVYGCIRVAGGVEQWGPTYRRLFVRVSDDDLDFAIDALSALMRQSPEQFREAVLRRRAG